MPQQRSKDKALVGGFIHKDLKNQLKRIARAEGKTMTELAIELFEDGVAKRGRKGLVKAGRRKK